MKVLTKMECAAVTGAENNNSGSAAPTADRDPIPQNVKDNLDAAFNNKPSIDFGFSASANNTYGTTQAQAGVHANAQGENWSITANGNANSNHNVSGSITATYHF